MGDFFARLTDPPVLAQLFAVLIAVLVAIAAAGALRAWHRRRRGPAPGAEEIAKLLKTTLAAVKVDSHVDWSAIIELLTDCSAAMVVKAANDAAKRAVLSGHKVVREADLRTAIGELRRPAKS